MAQKTYKVLGMHCASCAVNIEWELEDKGIKAKCNYAKQVLELETEITEPEEKEIKNIISSLGYHLGDTI